ARKATVIGTTDTNAHRRHLLSAGRAALTIGAAAHPKYRAWEWVWSRWSNGSGRRQPASPSRRTSPRPVAARYTAIAVVTPRIRGCAIFPVRIGTVPEALDG